MVRQRKTQANCMWLTIFVAALMPGIVAGEEALNERESAIEFHGRALERAGMGGMDPAETKRFIADFESTHCAPAYLAATDADERREVITSLLKVIQDTRAAETMIAPDWVRVDLFLPGKTYEVTYTMTETAPYLITSLSMNDVTADRPNFVLTKENLAATFAKLEAAGFAGAIHVRKDGEVLLDRACGVANEPLGYPIKRNTVFGIGSTPMDFTYVGIRLLEQRGLLSLKDTLTKFYSYVPEDKATITIGHLLNGQSGLPDFFDTRDDWDADLAYIDRTAAEERIFAQELLFEPGTDQRGSHGAYGLLAAIIERASGKDYFTFMKENFFDPAGMTRTAMNGDAMGLPLSEFAVGHGPMLFGLPNIPPNWGKTSWLILGSGGMCSTLEDMLKFFACIRSGDVLEPPYNARFNRFGASLNGSVRGAYLAHAYTDGDNESILMSSIDADSPREGTLDENISAFVRALEAFIAE